MRPRTVIGLMLGFAAIAAGSAEARPARTLHRAPQQAERPRLVIAEADGGFVIRCETKRGPQGAQFRRGAIPPFAIPLGASVRIDRAALPQFNEKDISHGEIR